MVTCPIPHASPPRAAPADPPVLNRPKTRVATTTAPERAGRASPERIGGRARVEPDELRMLLTEGREAFSRVLEDADDSGMAAFLATYRPIISTLHGRRAVSLFNIPPYVDSSCRREPDFESSYPSISALCRGKLFAPRLSVDDLVVYITRKGRYGAVEERHWRLVAVMRVLRRFDTHESAAAWYLEQGQVVPKNCMVEGNPPEDLERTGGQRPHLRYGDPADAERVIRRWDVGYRTRAKACGVILATEPVLLDLHDPPIITEQDLAIFGGRMPGTQNPPRIDPAIVDRLLDFSRRRNAA